MVVISRSLDARPTIFKGRGQNKAKNAMPLRQGCQNHVRQRHLESGLPPYDLIYCTLRWKSGCCCQSPAQVTFKQGETEMGEKGKKDKGKREGQKQAHLSLKEKRKVKKGKKIENPPIVRQP